MSASDLFWVDMLKKKDAKLADAEVEIEVLQEVIQRLRRINPPKFKHFCVEWDELEIDEYDPEFSACTCYREESK